MLVEVTASLEAAEADPKPLVLELKALELVVEAEAAEAVEAAGVISEFKLLELESPVLLRLELTLAAAWPRLEAANWLLGS